MLVLKSVSKTLTILTPCCGNMYEEAGRKVVGGAVVLLSLSTRNRVKSGLQRQDGPSIKYDPTEGGEGMPKSGRSK